MASYVYTLPRLEHRAATAPEGIVLVPGALHEVVGACERFRLVQEAYNVVVACAGDEAGISEPRTPVIAYFGFPRRHEAASTRSLRNTLRGFALRYALR